MGFTGGIILLAIALAMIFFGKARKGKVLPIFRVWIVGQAFVMSAMVIGVFGVAAIIVNWPF
ncbi:MAG: hypothetical protein WCD56_12405 [Pseudolabrys sp.]